MRKIEILIVFSALDQLVGTTIEGTLGAFCVQTSRTFIKQKTNG
ncbi:hypothetical protein [Paenisporosarcina indica]|nr:hypothetical protein [Paenisporosarcina indica]